MNGSSKKRALFLDRDGVLIKVRYLENVTDDRLIKPRFVTAEDLLVLPGVPEALQRFHDAGFLTVVVTNQGYVGRGVVTMAELDAVHARLNELLRKTGYGVDAFYVCPHPADAGCECRKPKPLLFRRAAEDLGIDLSQSLMVGDRLSDIQAGRAAGCCESILVRDGGWGSRTLAALNGAPDFPVCSGLPEVADLFTSFPEKRSKTRKAR